MKITALHVFGYVMLFFVLTFIFASVRIKNEELAAGSLKPAPITTTYKNVQCYIEQPDLICPGQAPTTGPR